MSARRDRLRDGGWRGPGRQAANAGLPFNAAAGCDAKQRGAFAVDLQFWIFADSSRPFVREEESHEAFEKLVRQLDRQRSGIHLEISGRWNRSKLCCFANKRKDLLKDL